MALDSLFDLSGLDFVWDAWPSDAFYAPVVSMVDPDIAPSVWEQVRWPLTATDFAQPDLAREIARGVSMQQRGLADAAQMDLAQPDLAREIARGVSMQQRGLADLVRAGAPASGGLSIPVMNLQTPEIPRVQPLTPQATPTVEPVRTSEVLPFQPYAAPPVAAASEASAGLGRLMPSEPFAESKLKRDRDLALRLYGG